MVDVLYLQKRDECTLCNEKVVMKICVPLPIIRLPGTPTQRYSQEIRFCLWMLPAFWDSYNSESPQWIWWRWGGPWASFNRQPCCADESSSRLPVNLDGVQWHNFMIRLCCCERRQSSASPDRGLQTGPEWWSLVFRPCDLAVGVV